MTLKHLLSLTRQAIDDYNMIAEGDMIAVGISGGKDSLTLLHSLASLRKFYPNKFDIKAITVDLGFDNLDFTEVKKMCDELDVEYHIINTDIANIVFDVRKESNPCSLCSKMRKGALNNAIIDLGCNKVAYAHHKDDVIETFMLSMMYEGRLHTFSPVTYLDKTGISIIRPLIYVNEVDVIGYVRKNNVPVVKSNCPADGYTKREYVHDHIQQLNRENPGVKERMFTAIKESGIDGWNIR